MYRAEEAILDALGRHAIITNNSNSETSEVNSKLL